MFLGKYRELIDNERMRCRKSQRTDGGDLLVIVRLELGPQCEVSRPLSLVCLEFSLAQVSDWCRAEVRDFVWPDHAPSLQSSHSRPRIALVSTMRIMVRMADIVLLARATRSS